MGRRRKRVRTSWFRRGSAGRFFKVLPVQGEPPVRVRAFASWLPDSLPPGVRAVLEEHQAARS